MWGIPLSGPLPIVAMVSRYLTIQLIGRILILYRNLYYYNDATIIGHEALIQISLGYSSVQGRLYTRYAPVRRSSASSKLLLLPLDLHVLSLPLAFILSQDQTLHC